MFDAMVLILWGTILGLMVIRYRRTRRGSPVVVRNSCTVCGREIAAAGRDAERAVLNLAKAAKASRWKRWICPGCQGKS